MLLVNAVRAVVGLIIMASALSHDVVRAVDDGRGEARVLLRMLSDRLLPTIQRIEQQQKQQHESGRNDDEIEGRIDTDSSEKAASTITLLQKEELLVSVLR